MRSNIFLIITTICNASTQTDAQKATEEVSPKISEDTFVPPPIEINSRLATVRIKKSKSLPACCGGMGLNLVQIVLAEAITQTVQELDIKVEPCKDIKNMQNMANFLCETYAALDREEKESAENSERLNKIISLKGQILTLLHDIADEQTIETLTGKVK